MQKVKMSNKWKIISLCIPFSRMRMIKVIVIRLLNFLNLFQLFFIVLKLHFQARICMKMYFGVVDGCMRYVYFYLTYNCRGGAFTIKTASKAAIIPTTTFNNNVWRSLETIQSEQQVNEEFQLNRCTMLL